MQSSPYTPGETAREIPGREVQLTDISGLLARVALDGRFAGRVRVDVGPRGVGKTSLLRRVQRTAHDLGLATVFVTAGNGVLTAVVADEVQQLARGWGHGDVLAERVGQVKLSAGIPGVAHIEATGADRPAPEATRAFRDLITHTARAAAQDTDRKGLVLLVDEFQSADEDSLRTIGYAWQELQASEDPVPAALLAAGLSHTPDVVTGAVTHAERFQYRPMRDLEPHETRQALTAPSAAMGVSWAMDALTTVVERAQGYPYFIQVYGDEVWHAAGNPAPGHQLTLDHVNAAQERVDIDLTELYRTRWAKATARERDILAAMADHPAGPVARRDIADQLGVDTTALSMTRQSLLDKGIVDAPGHGVLEFTVPGFGTYVRTLTNR
ncbi:ATP-binding protein [Ornithinimicrobium murale]|uniref:ATP-binding protein n=1 Tax=Ornithinimicrobium murale TaxID=1050153 RepID=UPI000E0D6C4C|nr:ATP-binding protein [Ornithinimicrobium murale]